ncbi:hypothetical protein BD413DRAFT_536337 [Trametes elegans]|nr:hypothetical protein BD413DRAFT_536337 [Trametes elegans]
MRICRDLGLLISTIIPPSAHTRELLARRHPVQIRQGLGPGYPCDDASVTTKNVFGSTAPRYICLLKLSMLFIRS